MATKMLRSNWPTDRPFWKGQPSFGGSTVERLPPEHPFRRLDNVIATPHIGYVSRDLYRVFYQDTVANIEGWLGRRS